MGRAFAASVEIPARAAVGGLAGNAELVGLEQRQHHGQSAPFFSAIVMWDIFMRDIFGQGSHSPAVPDFEIDQNRIPVAGELR
jgi:hypothetical protein